MQNLQDQKDLNQKEIQNLHKQLEIDISNPLVIKELTQHRNHFQQEINLIDQALMHHQQNYAQYLQQTQDIQANIDKLQTVLNQKSDFFCNHIQ